MIPVPPAVRPPSHRFEEHTGEVQVRLFAPTLVGLLTEAARALAILQLGDGETLGEPPSEVRVVVQARDEAALLVAWLNELIFQSETRGLVFTSIAIEEASSSKLVARIAGAPPYTLKTAVKAATYHAATVARTAQGFEAVVVLDV